MKTDDIKFWLLVAGIGGIAYWLYKKLPQITCKPVTAAANAYACATYFAQNFNTGEQSQLTGAVILPDGSSVAMTQLQVRSVPGYNAATFIYNATRYYLNNPSDANGNWQASYTLGS